MNEYIIGKLDKLSKRMSLPFYDKDTTEMIIPRRGKAKEMSVGDSWYIQVESYITHPPNGFDLHDNWNGGVVPQSDYLYCTILQIQGKMIKVKGNAFDPTTMNILDYTWEGWLPQKSIKRKEKQT